MRLKLNHWLLVAIVLVFMVGCASEKRDWEKAKLQNTIPAYETFLRTHPQSSLMDSARSRIEKLYKERDPAFINTRTIRLIVKQSYGKADAISLPFEELAQRLSKYAGLKVIGADENNFDAILKINVKGKILGATYLDDYARYHYRYTGASLSGSILLEVSGITYCKRTFKSHISPPEKISDYPTKSSAPLHKAFRESSFKQYMLEIFGKYYGYHCIVHATLRDKDPEIRKISRNLLGKINIAVLNGRFKNIYKFKHYYPYINENYPYLDKKKLKREALAELRYAAAKLLGEIEEPTAIEPLISALKDEYPPVRRAAAKSLTKITEEDFGINHDRWQNWRKQNK